MTLDISGFKNKLKGGGARSNLFEASISSFPVAGVWNDVLFNFLCKATALPASNVSAIDVPFRGRILKVAGDRTFDPWTVTVINDTGFELRKAFEEWMQLGNELTNNGGSVDPSTYMKDATVTQLGRKSGSTDGVILATYTFYNIFPTNVSAIDLSYDSTDSIEEFTVELQVQYIERTV